MTTFTPDPTGSGEPVVVAPADPRRPAVLAVWRAVEERYPNTMPVDISKLPSPAEYAQAVMEEVLRQGWQPPAVSPAPDTWDLRHRLAARLARLDAEQWGGDHDFAPYGKDRESDSVVDAAAKVFEAVQAEREAGLRADLDQARAEVERLETLVLEKHELIQGWARYGERVKAERAKYGDMLISALGITGPVGRWFEHLVPAAVQEIERLRDELAGARTIPDDADDYVIGALARRMRNAGEPLSDVQTSVLVDVVTTLFRSWLSTPTTDPAAEVEYEGPESCFDRECDEYVDDEGDDRPEVERCSHIREVPAAPQAPAEPTAHVMLCPVCGTYTAGVSGETCVNDGAVLHPTEPLASCGYHTEAEAQRSIRHELCTPAAREDAATPPLPLHEQADLLTWRVVHVPPGTTDREDTDTPITPGWWLVGHGDDPDHPDVQVHLGDRLPTSSAATPGDEYNDDLDGWARPTPIQPEEA